jgi:hypothetical protein
MLLISRFRLFDLIVIASSSADDILATTHRIEHIIFKLKVLYKNGNKNKAIPAILFSLVCKKAAP